MTQPTVTRQIAALEIELSVTLFERTGRSVTLTQAGLELLDHVRTMAEGANMLLLTASGKSQTIEGQVRLTASEMTATYLLPLMLDQLRATAPKLEIDIVADNNVRDRPLLDPNLVGRSSGVAYKSPYQTGVRPVD